MRVSGHSIGRVSGLAFVALAAGLTGCGDGAGAAGPRYAVTGRVLLADGKPLTTGRVTFVGKDGLIPPASGAIGPDGRFSLTTRDPDDGAVAGEYKVRIEPSAPTSGAVKAAKKAPRIPLKYIDEDSSGLIVTVRAEANQLDPIRLK